MQKRYKFQIYDHIVTGVCETLKLCFEKHTQSQNGCVCRKMGDKVRKVLHIDISLLIDIASWISVLMVKVSFSILFKYLV